MSAQMSDPGSANRPSGPRAWRTGPGSACPRKCPVPGNRDGPGDRPGRRRRRRAVPEHGPDYGIARGRPLVAARAPPPHSSPQIPFGGARRIPGGGSAVRPGRLEIVMDRGVGLGGGCGGGWFQKAGGDMGLHGVRGHGSKGEIVMGLGKGHDRLARVGGGRFPRDRNQVAPFRGGWLAGPLGMGRGWSTVMRRITIPVTAGMGAAYRHWYTMIRSTHGLAWPRRWVPIPCNPGMVQYRPW